MLQRDRLQDELAHVSQNETCCFGAATLSLQMENISLGNAFLKEMFSVSALAAQQLLLLLRISSSGRERYTRSAS